MNVFDLHCDTVSALYAHPEKNLSKNDLHIDMEKLSAGGSRIQCFALFDDKKISSYDITYLKKYIDFYYELINQQEALLSVTKASEINPDKINALLTMEDAGSLAGSYENLLCVYERGVRMIAISWNYENAYGYPNSTDAKIMQAGLKPAGIKLVRQMNELGMIIDVSHMSYGCFYDVAKYSKKPFIASHSCCEAIADHTRNLTDEMLKAIAESGGVCGINFCSLFLNGSEDMTYISDVIRQAKHIKNVAGIDSIAMGSDFDGIGNKLEFKDFSGMPRIASALMENGFTASETEKIMYKNAYRVFSEVCK